MKALVLAVRLNEAASLEEVYLGIPMASVDLVGRDLPRTYLERVLRLVAGHLEKAVHIEFNLRWVVALLGPHAAYIRLHRAAFAPTLRAVHKALHEHRDGLVRLADSNRFALAYLTTALDATAPAAAATSMPEVAADTDSLALERATVQTPDLGDGADADDAHAAEAEADNDEAAVKDAGDVATSGASARRKRAAVAPKAAEKRQRKHGGTKSGGSKGEKRA